MTENSRHQIQIRPEDLGLVQTIREIFEAKELLWVLVRRQISIRYAQTAFGALWVVIQPVMAAALYSVVFGLFVKVKTGGVPYPLFSYSGMAIWMLFSQGLERGSTALVQDERLVTKTFFPRLLLPVSTTLSVGLDFLVASIVLILCAWFMGFSPGINTLLVFTALVPVVVCSLGFAALFSSLNVRWRDLRQVAPFLVQIWVWATPVAYPLELAPGPWRTILLWNPLTAPVMMFRHAILGTEVPPMWAMGASYGISFLFFLIGVVVFKKVEKTFADYI